VAHQWKAGDRAKCVLGLDSPPDGYGARAANECSVIKEKLAPTVGSEWRVDAVELHWRDEELCELVYLRLCGQPSDIVFDARHFRPILPADPAFTEAMRSLKPKVPA